MLTGVLSQTTRSEWHRSYYPNPHTHPADCGRSKSSSICDPSHLLTHKQANELDALIQQIRNTTKCPCSTYQCEVSSSKGYAIVIGLVNKMDTGLIGMADDEKKGSRGSLDDAIEFADSIQTVWAKTNNVQCGEDVVIFYSAGDNVVFTRTGSTARKILNDERLGHISSKLRVKFSTGSKKERTFKALRQMLWNFEDVFKNHYDSKNNMNEPFVQEVRSNSPEFKSVNVYSVILTTLIIAFLSKVLG